MKLVEFSPLTLAGSFHKGLIFNKLWMIQKLSQIQDYYSVIYILGSWYGNMSILLAKSDIEFDHIVNVDKDAKVLRQGQQIAQRLGIADQIEPMVKDANKLDYRQLDRKGLVINSSCHDMKNQGWFDNIPNGVIVALQTRDDVDCDLDNYPMQKILYQGSIQLRDPETEYTSLLKIGRK
jgi:SAM-dependent methyltransferase